MASKSVPPDAAGESDTSWSGWKTFIIFTAMIAFFALFLFFARARP